MGHAYTPGLRVTGRTLVRKKRMLPIQGQVVVEAGQQIESSTVIARTDLPGKVHILNVVNLLSIAPGEIRHFMLKKEGETFKKDEVIAETRPFLKFLKTTVNAPIDGTIETISEVTGQVLLREPPKPLLLLGYIDGKVVEILPKEGAIVETIGAYMQGIFGVGGETDGEIVIAVKSPDEILGPDKILPQHKGKIVVGGSLAVADTFKRVKEVGAKGIVVGGFHDKDLKALLGKDLGVAITGTEQLGFTLVVTEGFGKITMAKKTFDLLSSKAGKKASMSGATQIRAGVIRPEVIIAETELQDQKDTKENWERGALKIGDPVRIIREPHFGTLGNVSGLPNELQAVETESKVRVLEVEFPGGKKAVIPRANVEIIED
jgi:hypothetical protein